MYFVYDTVTGKAVATNLTYDEALQYLLPALAAMQPVAIGRNA